MSEREQLYGRDEDGHSARGVRLEGANDLAYRCVMPRELGVAIVRLATDGACGRCAEEEKVEQFEEVATLLQRDALQAEVTHRRKQTQAVIPAVQVTMALALGLRLVRVEYAKRIAAWKELWSARHTLEPGVGQALPNVSAKRNGRTSKSYAIR